MITYVNIHHLELFYYVARYKGITRAADNIPYGIQQPAISGQIKQLEEALGVELFQRRPFQLTPAGEEIYGVIEKFFSKVIPEINRICGDDKNHLRLAAAAAVLTDHLPVVLKQMRTDFPELRLTLREVGTAEVESLLRYREVDIAVTLLRDDTGSAIRTETLIELPLVILVPASDRYPQFAAYKTFTAIKRTARNGEIPLPLISLPPSDNMSQLFRQGLETNRLRWATQMEVSSYELIHSYVAQGFGLGVTVDNPGVVIPESIHVIRLAKFPKMRIGMLHRGELKRVARGFANAARGYAAELRRVTAAKKQAAQKKAAATK